MASASTNDNADLLQPNTLTFEDISSHVDVPSEVRVVGHVSQHSASYFID